MNKKIDILKKQIINFETQLNGVLGRTPGLLDWCKYGIGGVIDHFVYGTSISDYFELDFYHMKAREKKTYYTQRFANKFDFALDTNESIMRHHSKIYEYRHLKKYFKREQLVSDEPKSREIYTQNIS